MVERKIHRTLALIILGLICAACGLGAARYQSIPLSLLALWLAFALAVETWPRRE